MSPANKDTVPQGGEQELAAVRAATLALPVFTAAARPAAGAYYAGVAIRVRDAGATTVQVCCQNSAAGWEWVTCGTST